MYLWLPVQRHSHSCDGWYNSLYIWRQSLGMAWQNGVIDLEQRLVWWESHVKYTEQWNKSWISLISTTSSFTHSSQISNISHVLPVEIFASIITTTSLQQQFQQSNRLLGSICVNLQFKIIKRSRIQIFTECYFDLQQLGNWHSKFFMQTFWTESESDNFGKIMQSCQSKTEVW